MEKRRQEIAEVNRQEFINLVRKIIDFEEGNRAKTVRFLDSDIATQLQVVKLNISNCLKESEDNPENVKYLAQSLDILNDVFTVARTMILELYPNYLYTIGLERTLEEYSWRYSRGMDRKIHFNSTIPENKLNSFEIDLQVNIYRIYVACQYHLIFILQVLEFNIDLSLNANEICFDFTVIKTNPYIKPLTKTDVETKHPFDLETIRARLMLLGGYVGEQTDWLNRITVFFPLPG